MKTEGEDGKDNKDKETDPKKEEKDSKMEIESPKQPSEIEGTNLKPEDTKMDIETGKKIYDEFDWGSLLKISKFINFLVAIPNIL